MEKANSETALHEGLEKLRELLFKWRRETGRYALGEFPRRFVTTDERPLYKKMFHHDFDADFKAAFGDEGVVGSDTKARAAFVRLVGWDLRYLFHGRRIVIDAQILDDQAFLRDLAEAFPRCGLYGGRGKRAQRRVSNLLREFTFGDTRAFWDLEYRTKVRKDLDDLFHKAKLPDSDSAWNVVKSAEDFNRHLRRLGLLHKGKSPPKPTVKPAK